jgi:hypothetical protein
LGTALNCTDNTFDHRQTSDADSSALDLVSQQIDDALDGGSIEDSLNGLELRLDHSERLVRLLTEKLELTALELGRIRNKTQTDNADAKQFEELNAEQQALKLLLHEFRSEWQDRYEGPSLQKISGQLEDVLDEIQRLPNLDATLIKQSLNGSYESNATDFETLPVEETHSVAGEAEESTASEESFVDAEEVSLIETLKIVVISSDQLSSADVGTAADDSTGDPEGCFWDLADAPDEDAEVAEWQSAIRTRDLCIAKLSDQQHQIAAHFNRSLDALTVEWDQTNPSESSVQELDILKALVQEQLRVAEVGISLNRAAVSRERMAVEYERSQLERRQSNEWSEDESSDEPPVLRRWLRFLSRKED